MLLAKNTGLNLAGMLIPLIVGVFTIPYAVRGLGEEGFGLLSIAWIVLGYLAMLDFGLSRASAKFIAEARNRSNVEIQQIFWVSTLINLVFGIIGAIFVLVFTPYCINSLLNIPEHLLVESNRTFIFFGISLPFVLLSTNLRGMIGAVQRFDLVNIILIPLNTLNFIIPALSLPLKIKVSTVVLLIVITRVIGLFIYAYFCYKIFPGIRHRPKIDFHVAPKLLRFGGWISITSIISPLLVYVDRFFISHFLTLGIVTYYTIPYDMLNRIRILPIAFMTTIFPEFSANSNNDSHINRKLFEQSFKYILILTGIACILLFSYAPNLLGIWLGEAFMEKSIIVFRLVSIGVFVNSLAYLPFNYFQGIGRPDIPAKFHLLELPIYISMLFILIHRFQINGVAFAWLIRTFLDFILLFIGLFKYEPKLKSIFKIKKINFAVLMLVFLVLMQWMNSIINSRSIIIQISFSFCVLLILSIITWFLLFDQQEKILLRKIFNRN